MHCFTHPNRPPSLTSSFAFQDDIVEQRIFAPTAGHNYKIEYVSANLWQNSALEPKPWSDIPEELRKRVDGILSLKIGFTEEDLQLFPSLKV